ncbi:hypothetical protein [Patiriisocius marinus]|nr:hypothetical protein [Patiriisocius marinus]
MKFRLYFCITLTSVVMSTSLLAQKKSTLENLKKEVSVLAYNDPELAITKGLELYDLSKNSSTHQVSALLSVANAYAVLKDHDAVFKYALKADSIAELNRNYTDHVRVLGFIGGQYRRLNLSDRALNYLNKAYNLTIKHPLPDSLEFIQGNILVVKGLIQKDELGCEYALPYLSDAVKVFKKNTDKVAINANLAIALNNLGDCNIELQNYKDAKINYNEAIISAEIINAIKNVASSKLGLAKLLSIEGKNKEAIALLEYILDSITDIHDGALNSQILKALSENYKQIGNENQYRYYSQLYLEEEQKLFKEEKKSLNKVTKEISSENHEKRQYQKDKYSYVFLFCGIILILLMLIIYRKILKKRNKIAQSKEKIEKSDKLKKEQ